MNLKTQMEKNLAELPEARDIKVNGRPVTWKAQAGSQKNFMQTPAFECLYHGTRGPGKSDALLMSFLQHVDKGFDLDWKGIIFRRTFPELKDIIEKSLMWFPRMYPNARYNHSEHFWTFATGEQLLFRQFLREDDYWKYHGHGYPFLGWDELTTWPDLGGYQRMISCCRSSNPLVPRMLRATTNPYGPGHNAVKFYFELPALDGKAIARPYRFEDPDTGVVKEEMLFRLALKGTIYENKILLRAQPQYIQQLKDAARNKAELAAWLEGSWDIVAGGMFGDVWAAKFNQVPRFVVPHSWRLDRTFDWGSSKPFSAGWWAQSDGTDLTFPDGRVMSTIPGDLFRVGEWYGWNGKPNQGCHALAVDISKGMVEFEMAKGWGSRVMAGPADSSIYKVENGMSIARDMAKVVRINGQEYPGVSFTPSDKSPGSRKTGWEMMRKMMRNAHKEPMVPREHPGLFVTEDCPHFIRTVPVLPRLERDMDDVDTDAEDHIGDESRYRVRKVGGLVTSSTHIIG